MKPTEGRKWGLFSLVKFIKLKQCLPSWDLTWEDHLDVSCMQLHSTVGDSKFKRWLSNYEALYTLWQFYPSQWDLFGPTLLPVPRNSHFSRCCWAEMLNKGWSQCTPHQCISIFCVRSTTKGWVCPGRTVLGKSVLWLQNTGYKIPCFYKSTWMVLCFKHCLF